MVGTIFSPADGGGGWGAICKVGEVGDKLTIETCKRAGHSVLLMFVLLIDLEAAFNLNCSSLLSSNIEHQIKIYTFT